MLFNTRSTVTWRSISSGAGPHLRDDIDLDVRDVGKCLDRQPRDATTAKMGLGWTHASMRERSTALRLEQLLGRTVEKECAGHHHAIARR